MEGAFEAAKAALAAAAELAHPQHGAELALMVDASAEHMGAALQQRLSPLAAWQPLGFYSKKFDPAQVRYSAFDRELLACCSGIRHFRWMLEGRRFTIYTDHKPLTFALFKAADAWTARQGRQLSYVAEFTSDIRHVPGVENVVADNLSRPPPASPAAGVKVPPGSPAVGSQAATCGTQDGTMQAVSAVAASGTTLDWPGIAARQQVCPATRKARASSLQLEERPIHGVALLCDVSRGAVRPLIPVEDRRAVFWAVHNLAHPGIRATRRLMTSRFVWRGMSSDINAWCRECTACHRAKVTRQPPAAVQPIPVPAVRFTHIHVDLVGPLPTSADGYVYLFTIIDRSTRWLEAIPLRSMDTAACVDALITGWVARFGVPSVITSDQGRQFCSALWTNMCSLLGVDHSRTTAYHPQSNGMVERAHRQLKDALRARLAGAAWPLHLPWVLLGLRAAPKEDSAVSSAELLYGAPVALPAEFIAAEEPPVESFVEKLRSVQPPPTRPLTYAQVTAACPPALMAAEYVYVRRGGVVPPLSPLYVGPFRVKERAPKFFKLEIGGREEVVSVDRLKPHLGKAPVAAAEPPARGRPSKSAAQSDVVAPPVPRGPD
jgi:transposase InsO family protein